jgi:uncharacterized membrane protein (DUF2068 family)
VTVLGVLAILAGVLGIVGGAILLGSSDSLLVLLSATAVILGVLYLLTGVGLLRGIGWAWGLGIIVSALSLARNLTEIAFGEIEYGVPGVIIAVAIIYYLARPQVRSFFTRGQAPSNESRSD